MPPRVAEINQAMTPAERDTSYLEMRALAGLLRQAGALKRLRRQGWVDRGVVSPESVADHSYRLALLVLILASRSPGVDPCRAVTLALVHDLPEALAGDITPFDDALGRPGVDRSALFRQRPVFDPETYQAKKEREREAVEDLTSGLPEDVAALVQDAWLEYESGSTPEARLVRQADKLETWLQALEYAVEQPELVIESFRIGTREAVDDPALAGLLNAIDGLFDSGDGVDR
jgi:putative hydrolases of HD superfamily